MARINVDEYALNDPRFEVLAALMSVGEGDYARGRMLRVWSQCANRETYVLPGDIISAIFKSEDAPDWLVRAGLAQKVDDGFRIRGTKGRTDYLKKKRATARQNGKLGGRKRKPTLVPDGNLSGTYRESSLTLALAPTPALAPSLAPSLALEEREETPKPPFDSETWFTRFWEGYPRKGKRDSTRYEWDRLIFDEPTAAAVVAAVAKWKASGEWKDLNFVPISNSFLRDKRWQDEPIPVTEKHHAERSNRTAARYDAERDG